MTNFSDLFEIPAIFYSIIPFVSILFFIISTQLFNIILVVSRKKNISVAFEERSAHTTWCTNLGGIVIYFGLIFSFNIFGAIIHEPEILKGLHYFSAATTLLFFVGLKDDLVEIDYIKKIMGQFIAFSIFIFLIGAKIHSLGGLFGINELPEFVSISLTYLVLFFIVNSFNLADGIDGLAGSISLIIVAFMGIFFYINSAFTQSLISFTLVGILIGYLKFNFSKTDKILMGDSGSLVLGFLIAYQFFNFQSYSSQSFSLTLDKNIFYLIALFSYPLVDTIRIFFVRIFAGKSPFKPDKNHIHHLLLNKGLTHMQATAIISVSTIFILIITHFSNNLEFHLSFSILVFSISLTYLILIKVKSSFQELTSGLNPPKQLVNK
jgi:UDP-GlcNAc:undecaprenyl-phosphate GlcNAc-1-phosphate transferase